MNNSGYYLYLSSPNLFISLRPTTSDSLCIHFPIGRRANLIQSAQSFLYTDLTQCDFIAALKLMVSCCEDSLYRSPQRMEMTPLILIILGVSGGYCDSHSMRYYSTAVSSPGSGLPVFSSVGYVDDKEITNYNSDTRQYLPKTEWMKKLGSDYWEGQTQAGRGNEAVGKHNVQTMMSRFNQTGGIHIVQWMFGCELRDDGTTAGYNQYGYDGREFMSLDTQRGIYIPTMNEAQITTQRLNSPDVGAGERQKNYLENICIEWLKKYINNGREDLEKRGYDPY